MIKHTVRRALSMCGAHLLGGFGRPAMSPIPPGVALLGEERSVSGRARRILAGSLVLTATLVVIGPSGAGAVTAPIVGIESTASGTGYWLVNSTGGEYSFAAPYLAPTYCDPSFTGPVLGIASTPDHLGFWEYDANGQLACFGDAGFFGDTGSLHINSPVVGMAATPDGQGYELVEADGGDFSFGDGRFYGSEGGQPLPRPIAGIAEYPIGQSATTGGYWMFSTGGHVYPFGSAVRYGTMNSRHQVVDLASTGDGLGYWVTESDGHVSHFGDAAGHGSTSAPGGDPIVAMAVSPDGGGYWEVDATGIVYPHGDAVFHGSVP